MTEAEEGYAAVAVYGGIIFAGSLIACVLTLVGIALKNRITRKTITKEIYGEKERKNGQHKNGTGGARGRF